MLTKITKKEPDNPDKNKIRKIVDALQLVGVNATICKRPKIKTRIEPVCK